MVIFSIILESYLIKKLDYNKNPNHYYFIIFKNERNMSYIKNIPSQPPIKYLQCQETHFLRKSISFGKLILLFFLILIYKSVSLMCHSGPSSYSGLRVRNSNPFSYPSNIFFFCTFKSYFFKTSF